MLGCCLWGWGGYRWVCIRLAFWAAGTGDRTQKGARAGSDAHACGRGSRGGSRCLGSSRSAITQRAGTTPDGRCPEAAAAGGVREAAGGVREAAERPPGVGLTAAPGAEGCRQRPHRAEARRCPAPRRRRREVPSATPSPHAQPGKGGGDLPGAGRGNRAAQAAGSCAGKAALPGAGPRRRQGRRPAPLRPWRLRSEEVRRHVAGAGRGEVVNALVPAPLPFSSASPPPPPTPSRPGGPRPSGGLPRHHERRRRARV